jgi:RNA polymerase sigma-70 factor (ECF subfamily)
LLAAVAMGDREAFRALYDAVAPRLRGWALRSTGDAGRAEDIVHEVMLRLWHHADRYDPARASAQAWVFAIARNARIDRDRRDRAGWLLFEDEPRHDAAGDGGTDPFTDAARVRAAVDDLPEDQRRVVERAWFEGASLPDVAAAESLPLGTVKSRLRLALGKLRARLGEADA